MRHSLRVSVLLMAVTLVAASLFAGVPGAAWAYDASNPQEGDHANSYRYSDGELVEPGDGSVAEGSNQTADAASDESLSTELMTADSTYTWFYRSGNNVWYYSSTGLSGLKAWGIDVSEHQGAIDWNAVANSGVDYVVLRCGYGGNATRYDDDQWEANVAACERLGIPYGVYLYSYATSVSDAQSEARHALRLLQGHHPQLPVYYDLEDSIILENCTKSEITSMARTFCDAIANAGYTPGIYCNLYWRNTYLTDPVYNSWSNWIAQYNSRCTYGGAYDMWQSGFCTVNGITGDVDNDFMVVDLPQQHRPSYGGSLVTDVPSGTYKICQASSPNYVLDNGGSPDGGGNVRLWSNAGASDTQQLWTFRLQSDGTYKIFNADSGMVLGSDPSSNDNGTNVQQSVSDSSRAERWYAERLTNGNYAFQNARSGKYLDITSAISADGTNVELWASGNVAAQTFELRPLSYYQATDSDTSNSVTIYRLYNQWTGEHIFTTDLDEYASLGSLAWKPERIAWNAPKSGKMVYRLYNPYSGDHHYTLDADENERLARLGWRQEGVAFYSADKNDEGAEPVYRLYNPWLTSGSHLFTTSASEYAALQTEGWNGEGVAFYGLQ